MAVAHLRPMVRQGPRFPPSAPLLAGIRDNADEVHLLDLSSCTNIVRRLRVPQGVYDLSAAQLGLLCVSAIDGCLSYVLDPAAAAGEVVVATLPDVADDVDLQQQDGSFQPVPGLVPDRASFRGSSPTLLGHVPSTGEFKALVTNGYCTGRDGGVLGVERITRTCNVITLGGGAAAAADGGGEKRWRARPSPPVGGPSSCLRDI